MRFEERHGAWNSPESQDCAKHDVSLSCSVIIPTLNSGRYLDIALTSLVAQTRRPSEVIIVDAGSTDRTAEIATSFSDRLTIRFIEAPKISIGPARNIGIEQAIGDLVCFLDSDDIFLSGRLEATHQILCEDPGLDAAYGFQLEWDSAKDRIYLAYDYEKPFDAEIEIFTFSLINLSTIAIRRHFLLDQGIRFSEDWRGRYGEDWNFCAQLIAAGARMRYRAEPVSLITVRSDSNTQPGLLWKARLCTLRTLLTCAGPVLRRRGGDAIAQARILDAIDLWRLKCVVTLLIAGRPGAARRIVRGFRSKKYAILAAILNIWSRLSPCVEVWVLRSLVDYYVSRRKRQTNRVVPVTELAFIKLRERIQTLMRSSMAVEQPTIVKEFVRS